MPERYRYSWMTDLEDPDFIALLNALEHFRNDVVNGELRGKGAAIWGYDVMESAETMYNLFLAEWERRDKEET